MAQAEYQGALQMEQETETRFLKAFDAGRDDLLWCDGVILGTPENFGYMSGALKEGALVYRLRHLFRVAGLTVINDQQVLSLIGTHDIPREWGNRSCRNSAGMRLVNSDTTIVTVSDKTSARVVQA